MAEKRWNGYYALRFAILERDDFACQYCGQHAPNVALEIDHIKPVSEGGQDTLDNLRTSCWACNRGRAGTQIRTELKMRKLREKKIKEPILYPTQRVRILELLSEKPGMSSKDIAETLGFNQNSVMVRLSGMKKDGLVGNKGYPPGWHLIVGS